jgi:hypothetical protein
MFWSFLTLESVSLVVRTVAALYNFSMTAATSSILAIGWRKIAYGRRSPDLWLDISLDDGGASAPGWLLFGFRNNSMNALDLARVQV